MKQLTIPDVVRIGADDFKIVYPEVIIIGNKCDYAGSINTETKQIALLEEYTPEQRLSPFFHELVHGIFREANLRELFENEDVVDRVGRVLHQIMRDNYFYKDVVEKKTTRKSVVRNRG
ncbi:hypothetical protein A7K50_03180 [Dehalobacter sp. MCB1]|uniref:hypothetical protein n=1 Tax=Dehalobacter sp. MCB1 TaxID=1844756 RepID=UPI000E6C5565|nr:hypothetical protein [Dehalobacter sp. MCB1]RJE47664.1 hypothetical protein A7K50_03180 [Dehalobacter sp. MCB1]